MKKIISTCIALMVSAACSISAFAMEVPTIHECALRTFYDPCIYGWPR